MPKLSLFRVGLIIAIIGVVWIGFAFSEGLLELRKEIAKKENIKGLSVGAEDILVTNGISEGLDMVISSIVEEGDEVLLPGPYYPPYASYVRLRGGTPVEFEQILTLANFGRFSLIESSCGELLNAM